MIRRFTHCLSSSALTLTAFASCIDSSEIDSEVPAEPEPGSSDGPRAIHSAQIHTPDGLRNVRFEIIGGKAIAGGDIILPDEVLPSTLRSAPAAHVERWSQGIVPYEIDPALPNPQRVHDAITHYQRFTAVRLVPRTNQTSFVRFVPSPECSSRVGKSIAGQVINLAPGCGTGSTIHELGHALGLWHEQSRFDRNAHVLINWQNIEPGKEHNFDMEPVDGAANYGPYDLGSIMHYDSFAFSTGTGPTITRINGSLIASQRNGLSDGDLQALESMYPTRTSAAPAMCRTAPPRGSRRRASVAEVWSDVGAAASFATHASTKVAFAPPVAWATRDGGFDPKHRWLAGDFDGDGDQDLLGVWNDGNLNTLTLRRSSNTAFSHEHWARRQGGWIDSTQWLPGDFNGDGRTDVAGVWNDGGQASVAVFLSTGTSFAPHTQWLVRDGGWSDGHKWNVGDFNNDGRDDLFAAWNDGGATTLTVRRSNGSTFAQQHWAVRQGSWSNDTEWLTGNFDGVGGSDVIAVKNDAGNATFTMFPSTGSAFALPRDWAIWDGGWASNMKWRAGDFDMDGRADVLGVWNDGGMSTLTVRRSTGTSLHGQVHWGVRRGGWQDSASWCTGTFGSGEVAPVP